MNSLRRNIAVAAASASLLGAPATAEAQSMIDPLEKPTLVEPIGQLNLLADVARVAEVPAPKSNEENLWQKSRQYVISAPILAAGALIMYGGLRRRKEESQNWHYDITA
jgi:hypothetical protein